MGGNRIQHHGEDNSKPVALGDSVARASHEDASVAIEGLFRERLSQHVGRVIVGGHPLNDDVALGDDRRARES